MPSPVEIAVDTYVRAAHERDPSRRAALLEACFADDGRMVTASRELRGRAAIAELLTRAHVDPKGLVGIERAWQPIGAGAKRCERARHVARLSSRFE